jgi:hypothetical protein
MGSPISISYVVPPGWLFRLCVLGFCGDEDGDVRLGVFPEREEILIGSLGLDAVALQDIRDTRHARMPYENGFLNLISCSISLLR